jgi:hypothetical protein
VAGVDLFYTLKCVAFGLKTVRGIRIADHLIGVFGCGRAVRVLDYQFLVGVISACRNSALGTVLLGLNTFARSRLLVPIMMWENIGAPYLFCESGASSIPIHYIGGAGGVV